MVNIIFFNLQPNLPGQFFTPNRKHISAFGHRIIATEISHLLKKHITTGEQKHHKHKHFDGSWGFGDTCVSWFNSKESIPLKYNGAKEIFTESDHAYLEFDYENGGGSIVIINNKKVEVPLYFSYMLSATKSLKTEIIVDDEVTVLDPGIVNNFVVETSFVGIAKPGKNTVVIKPLPGNDIPFRLIAVELFGFRYHQGLPLKKMHNRVDLGEATESMGL